MIKHCHRFESRHLSFVNKSVAYNLNLCVSRTAQAVSARNIAHRINNWLIFGVKIWIKSRLHPQRPRGRENRPNEWPVRLTSCAQAESCPGAQPLGETRKPRLKRYIYVLFVVLSSLPSSGISSQLILWDVSLLLATLVCAHMRFSRIQTLIFLADARSPVPLLPSSAAYVRRMRKREIKTNMEGRRKLHGCVWRLLSPWENECCHVRAVGNRFIGNKTANTTLERTYERFLVNKW